ncbi:phosphotransferase enzyme family protein [Cellulomonas fimi]|uniref:Phosphotransferase n=1 Tax=Cellulomonas fimi TaxID=1708 RepID=A0A7Y0M199_CELFI|nr:phosphotransferase [Cellulomonas fimi]NMR21680.1 phosphotransferase [Cellulomonas fimi]
MRVLPSPTPAPVLAPVAVPDDRPDLRPDVPDDVAAPHDPLPLPPAGWGAADGLDALAEARLALPFELPEADVASVLTTIVLRSGGYAVKVYPPGTDPRHLGTVAAALTGTRTAHVASAPPVVTSSGVVCVSRWLTGRRAPGWVALGALLRRFHDEHAEADVPAWVPLRRLDSPTLALPDDAANVLLSARTALLGELAGLTSALGVGLVHGDVSLGNAVQGAAGPRLIDLDFAARGPREHDLASAARRVRSGEIDAATYRRFCRAYGFDVMTWHGLEVLDAIAELGAVAFRAWDDRRRGADRDWLPGVVARWRTPL